MRRPAIDAAATPDPQSINQRLDALLEANPPASTDPQEFWGAQFDAGLAWVHFPVGLGGLGAPAHLQDLVADRLAAAGAPENALRNFVGLGTVAPTLIDYGTEEQRAWLRPIFTCETVWCQLFSEPGAGSDLASLQTRAVLENGEWLVNGHKTWTTLAHVSRYGFLIARTNPDVSKHRGLTCFRVDMQAPGVTVRPVRQITGEAEFNEVILEDVVLSDSDRIGPVNAGWDVTISTLMNERNHNGEVAKRPRGQGPIAHALRIWHEREHDDPVLRDRLVRDWITAESIRLTAMRLEQRRTGRSVGAEGSLLKLVIGEFTQEVMDLCVDLFGLDGALIEGYEFRQPDTMAESTMGDGQQAVDIPKAFLNARSSTIGGGTTEMQRNTIAAQLLGLPRAASAATKRA